jgi:hypothetical protein
MSGHIPFHKESSITCIYVSSQRFQHAAGLTEEGRLIIPIMQGIRLCGYVARTQVTNVEGHSRIKQRQYMELYSGQQHLPKHTNAFFLGLESVKSVRSLLRSLRNIQHQYSGLETNAVRSSETSFTQSHTSNLHSHHRENSTDWQAAIFNLKAKAACFSETSYYIASYRKSQHIYSS